MAHMAIMSSLTRDERHIDERMSDKLLVLRPGTPISEISGRDLPSPADIKGEHNVLLLPYYQELPKKLNNNTEHKPFDKLKGRAKS